MLASQATLTALRFEQLRQTLSERARTEAGKVRAGKRPFLDDRAAIESAFALIEEARQLRQEPLSLPLGGLPDVRPLVERASRGGMLDPQELLLCTQALFAFEHTEEAIDLRKARLPLMSGIAQGIPVMQRLATRLEQCIEPAGTIADRASPGLKEARDRVRGLHRTIKGKLDAMLRDETVAPTLRESYYSVRNDRYVVPVNAQHQAQMPGIIHNASQTGQTLFVEPEALIGLGNQLAIAESVVLDEERKVLIELSGLLGKEADRIADGVVACAALDEAEAAGNLADALQASVPTLDEAAAGLRLRKLRHPLLVLGGTQVVANDVELEGTTRALVISGPNAGGKTITLTAVGLAALMTRLGLPIPADPGSVMPLFERIDSAVGDAQDLSRGLSTFSAHVTQLKEIVAQAKDKSLVMIDEIAADTDPREGAALATAVLEQLLEQGAIALVTTHLEELKALAHLDPRFVNARVGFDSAKMAPTYRLQLGAAGASSAIDVARRVGLPEAICARANDLAKNAGGALAKALGAAEAERQQLIEEKDRQAALAKEAQATLDRLVAEKAEIERVRRHEELRFREALKAELEFAKNQVRELLESVKKEKPNPKALEKLSEDLSARVQEQVVAEKQLREALSGIERPKGPAKLEVGGRAYLEKMDAVVEILEVDGDEVVVGAGPLKLRVKPSELGAARDAKSKPAALRSAAGRAQERLDRAQATAAKPFTAASPKIDVRGMRADEALRELEHLLDRATQQGDGAALVVHGHGTGALKLSVREYLERSPYAASFRPGESHEGGDGVTVVTLA